MTESARHGRMTLLLIAGTPVIIILASTWLWFYVASGKLDLVDMLGTANQGRLLDPPRAMEALNGELAAGQVFDPTASDEPLWRILVPVSADCPESCQHSVYYTRQIHTAMGKYQPRIERVLLAQDLAEDDPLVAELRASYPEAKVLYTSAADVEGLLGDVRADGEPPAYYLADPYGWIVLAYSASADGKDIMADLKFLLKNSNG